MFSGCLKINAKTVSKKLPKWVPKGTEWDPNEARPQLPKQGLAGLTGLGRVDSAVRPELSSEGQATLNDAEWHATEAGLAFVGWKA